MGRHFELEGGKIAAFLKQHDLVLMNVQSKEVSVEEARVLWHDQDTGELVLATSSPDWRVLWYEDEEELYCVANEMGIHHAKKETPSDVRHQPWAGQSCIDMSWMDVMVAFGLEEDDDHRRGELLDQFQEARH